MPTFERRAGPWRVQIYVKGVRDGGTFPTKAEAAAWAAKRETEIREDKATGIQRGKTVDDAFRRYEKEVSVHKPGHRWEALRLNAIGRTEIDGSRSPSSTRCGTSRRSRPA
jgi:hypothetical protein